MTETAVKPPTPHGISRLLREANFTRWDPTGCQLIRSGFVVGKSDIGGAVDVIHRFWPTGNTTAQYVEKLSLYAAVLEEAGWSCRIDDRILVVTTRDHSPTTQTRIGH